MERRKREGKRLNGEVQGEGVILAAGKEKGNERKGRQTCMRVSSSSQKAEKRVTGSRCAEVCVAEAASKIPYDRYRGGSR